MINRQAVRRLYDTSSHGVRKRWWWVCLAARGADHLTCIGLFISQDIDLVDWAIIWVFIFVCEYLYVGSRLENTIPQTQPSAKRPVIGPWKLQGRGLPEAGAILPYNVSGYDWSLCRNWPVMHLNNVIFFCLWVGRKTILNILILNVLILIGLMLSLCFDFALFGFFFNALSALFLCLRPPV